MSTVIMNTLIPLFAIMGLGFGAGKRAMLPNGSATALNTFVYKFTLPSLIFGSLATAPAGEVLQWNFMGGFTLAMLCAYLIMFLVSGFFFGSHFTEGGLRSAAASFPNTAYLGFPILISIFKGNPHAIIAVTLATLLPTAVLILAIGKLEFHRAEKGKSLCATASTVGISLIKTPIIGASFAGVLFSLLGLGLPKALGVFFHDFGMASVPCALFAMGMVIGKNGLTISPKDLMAVNLIKMVIQPVLATLFLLMFNVKGDWLIMGILLSGLPTAMAAYLIAEDYNIYEAGSSAAILVSTLLCIITIPATLLLAAHFKMGMG